MIHAICDFCGKDCDRSATLLSLTPFQNFARYHTDKNPQGNVDQSRNFVICHDCLSKHDLPNPYRTYTSITRPLEYEKCLNNYTDFDNKSDIRVDKGRPQN